MQSSAVREGDWVKGKTANDERFRGFVEAVSADRLRVKVMVTESDNEDIVGKVVESKTGWVGVLPPETRLTRTQLMSLIDVALSVGDEQWFKELAEQLGRSKQRKEDGLPMYDDATFSRRLRI